MRVTLVACLVGLLLLAPRPALAQSDLKDSRDHPLVGRYADAVIRAYEAKDFDEYTVGLGKLSFRNNVFHWARSEKVEGKVTRITYLAPATASPAAIIRSYEGALRQSGFEILFAADEQGLGYRYDSWHHKAYPDPQQRRSDLLSFTYKSARYLAAKLRRSEGDAYAVVYAALGGSLAKNLPVIQLDVIEVKALEKGLVTAKAMGEELAKTGRIAIYTLYFDTDKAELRPESGPTLAEIARLLQQSGSLKLYVVGHTDGTGALAHNVDLSQRRAEAGVQALTSAHGIDGGRLRSAGVGPLAPVAANVTDEGRARNRRVELVAQESGR